MPVYTWKVEGLRALGERLRNLDEATQKHAIREATKAGAKFIAKYAVVEAPRRTGLLKHSITAARLTAKSRSGIEWWAIVVKAPKGEKYAYYWRFVEYGTVKMSKRSFMRTALDENKNEAVLIMKGTLKEQIRLAESHANWRAMMAAKARGEKWGQLP